MTKIKYILLFVCLAGCLTACKKDIELEPDTFDHVAQFNKDTIAIRNFIKANNLTQIKKDTRPESGLFYQIIEPGTGTVEYNSGTQITATYEGRLLDGTVFDNDHITTPATFILGDVIPGWQYAIPLIKKGGTIRFIIPSFYAYRNSANTRIPANSPLDFTVTLVDVK